MLPTHEDHELLTKRFARLVSLGARLRVCQNDYVKFKGPITFEKMRHAQSEFDKIIREELKQLESKQQGLF